MASAKLVADHLAKRITFNVRILGVRRLAFRLKVAALIVRLAAMVAGVRSHVDVTVA